MQQHNIGETVWLVSEGLMNKGIVTAKATVLSATHVFEDSWMYQVRYNKIDNFGGGWTHETMYRSEVHALVHAGMLITDLQLAEQRRHNTVMKNLTKLAGSLRFAATKERVLRESVKRPTK